LSAFFVYKRIEQLQSVLIFVVNVEVNQERFFGQWALKDSICLFIQ